MARAKDRAKAGIGHVRLRTGLVLRTELWLGSRRGLGLRIDLGLLTGLLTGAMDRARARTVGRARTNNRGYG